MEKTVRRFFLLDYETINESLSRISTRQIEKTDYIYIIKRENIGQIRESVKRTISSLTKDSILEVKDCNELDDNNLKRYAIAEISKHINKKTCFYFVSCAEFRDLFGVDIERLCKSVRSISEVREAPPSGIDDPDTEEGNTEDARKNGTSKIQQARLQREKDRTASQKNTEESEDVRPRRDHPKDSGMGDFLDHIYSERKDSTHKTNASHDNMHNNVTRNSGGDRDKRHSNEKGADDVKTRQSPQKDTVTLRQLEKDIFSDAKIEDVVDPEYTQIDNDKIKLLLSMFERFKEHLNVVVKNPDNLEDDDYNNIIIQFVKSPNLDDFKTCNEFTNQTAQVEIPTEKIFFVLKGEAEYYIKMCDLFYKEDKWIE